MKTRIRNTETNEWFGSEREGVYLVDGTPQQLDSPLVQFEIIRNPYPTGLAENERAVQIETADLNAGTYTYGWTIEEFTPPVPTVVSTRQLFLALYIYWGITEQQIESLISNPSVITDETQRTLAGIEYRKAAQIFRTNPLIPLLQIALGKTEEDADNLFRAADKL